MEHECLIVVVLSDFELPLFSYKNSKYNLKTRQFMNVIYGVSHSHRTANGPLSYMTQ